jgi:hypothetical protein
MPHQNAGRQSLVSTGEQIGMKTAPNYKLTSIHRNLLLETANSSARHKRWI